MNDKQREYLLKSVTNVCNQQIKDLEATRRKKPALNNYLVAAFLDNTIEFADIENLKGKMREAVIKMPSDTKLIEVEKSNYWDEKETNNVKIPVNLIFKIPKAYLEEYDLWQKEDKQVTDQISQLRAQLNTVEIKIQLGSNQQLDKLIAEADNLGEISLINTKLTLTA